MRNNTTLPVEELFNHLISVTVKQQQKNNFVSFVIYNFVNMILESFRIGPFIVFNLIFF